MKKKNSEKIFAILMALLAMTIGVFLVYAVDTGWEAVLMYVSITLGLALWLVGLIAFMAYISGYMDK